MFLDLSCKTVACCFAHWVAAAVFLCRGCIQSTSPPCWGAWSWEGAEGAALTNGGEVELSFCTAEWEMWYLVVFVSISSKLTLNILCFKKC